MRRRKTKLWIAAFMILMLAFTTALIACESGGLGGLGDLARIEVTTQPSKTVYYEWDAFNPAGMVVTGYYEKGEAEIKNYTLSHGSQTALRITDTAVTVSYQGKTAEVAVTVHPVSQTPVITAEPQNGQAVQGAEFSLTVTASVTDGGTLSYQWYASGTAVNGAVNATFDVPTDTTGTFTYYCVVTNVASENAKAASKNSRSASVTVAAKVNAAIPAITTQPQGATVTEGQNYVLTVAASRSDSGTLSYQWYKNAADDNTSGTAVTGANAAAYNPPTNVFGSVYYYCKVTNTINDNGDGGEKTANVTTNAVLIRLVDATAITVEDITAYAGIRKTLTAALTPQDAGNTAVTFEFVVNTIGAEFSSPGEVVCNQFGTVTYKAKIGQLESNTATITFGPNPALGTVITTAAELYNIRTRLTASYQLGNDIDLSSYPNWTPIGETSSAKFTGTLNGNGFKITNLTISSLSANGVGLFGNVGDGGVIKNLTVENANITAGTAGIIAGVCSGTISNCTVSGSIGRNGSDYIGGIVGKQTVRAWGVVGAIAYSYPTGNVNNATVSGNDNIGGIAGEIRVSNAFDGMIFSGNVNNGSVSGNDNVGGIAGYSYVRSGQTFRENTNAGNISGGGYVGGLFGKIERNADSDSLAIRDCVNSGSVTATGTYTGGVLGGALVGGVTLTQCENTGAVTGRAGVGGIAGRVQSVNNCSNGGVVSATGSATLSAYETSTAKAYLGGIAGVVHDASNNVNTVNITYTGSGEGVGGIAGWVVSMSGTAFPRLYRNTNSGNITSSGGRVGGIVGEARFLGASGKIEECNNTGAVSGGVGAGGIAGYVKGTSSGYQKETQITACTNSGAVTSAGANAGGIVGYAAGENPDAGVNQGPHVINFISCENYGSVNGAAGATTGGILGGGDSHIQPHSGCANTGVINGGQSGHQLLP